MTLVRLVVPFRTVKQNIFSVSSVVQQARCPRAGVRHAQDVEDACGGTGLPARTLCSEVQRNWGLVIGDSYRALASLVAAGLRSCL